MTAVAVSPSLELSRLDRREIARWSIAALAIVALHLAVAYALQAMRAAEPDGGPPPALTVELAPVAFAPPVPEETVAADPVPTEVVEPVDEAEEISESPPDPVILPEPTEKVIAEQATTVPAETEADKAERVVPETVTPEAVPETPAERVEAEPMQETAPEIAATVAPEVVLPIPQPRPIRPEIETSARTVEEAVKPVEKKPVEKKAAKPTKKKDVKPAENAADAKKKPAKPSKAVATAKTDSKPAKKAAAPKKAESAAAQRADTSAWEGKVMARIRRNQRYPKGPESRGEAGKVGVVFTVDASGRVTSVRVGRSSGNGELDSAAVKAVQRASPFSAPPDATKRTLSFSVVFKK
jgi:protein TonB